MKFKKLFCLFSFVLLLTYGLFALYVHCKAVPAILAYLRPGYPEIGTFDLRIDCLPMPTRDWDIIMSYSFAYNGYGERLHLTYYLRNTRPIACSK